MDTKLFGFDVLMVALALLKFVGDQFKLDKKWVTLIGAFLASVSVAVVSLQAQGLILGPATQQWVVLALSCISVFLVTMGYGPVVVGTITAASDTIRMNAFEKVAAPKLQAQTEESARMAVVRNTRDRYGLRVMKGKGRG